MFLEYTSLVMAMYRRKAASGSLSTRLSRPTPANIKKECLAVCAERFSKADEGILKTFFGQHSDKEGYLKAIQKSDLDKFRPLINFIKERTTTPADINVELLAWLINYSPRPYQYDRIYETEIGILPGSKQEEGQIETRAEKVAAIKQPFGGEIIEGTAKASSPMIFDKNSKGRISNAVKKWVTFFLVGVICVGVLYALWPNKQNRQMKFGNSNTGCMYWTGDHYEVSPCMQRGGDTIVIAIDQARLKNFRRIDTSLINSISIGKVWYRIKNHKYFFYSAPGKDPVDGINLRRLTDSSYAKFERTRSN